MTRNQLPEGVGKKIVEALKRQAEADITPVAESEISIGANIPLTEIQELPDVNYEQLTESSEIAESDMIIEEESPAPMQMAGTFQVKEEPVVQRETYIPETPVVNEIRMEKYAPMMNQAIPLDKVKTPITNTTSQVSMPTNVTMLKNLIASLPVGVTKQTGAQIIRQTLEAMGIPMNSVLKEAQEMQEELNSSTRECMMRIQEYKSNILQLEQSVNEYQKNITQINDLISLFLLTDRK